nr:copia protein [Tanacetum cinerariifolium]
MYLYGSLGDCDSDMGISILLAVGTPSTGSGKLYCQWELSSSSGNALCILFPTIKSESRILKNKKDERGIVIRNKARLVAQGHTQEEGIDYNEVFAPVVRIEAIILFLAYASFMGFTVYQMDVKSAFFYGTIDEEVEFKALMHEKFQMSAMGELNFFLGLQVLQKEDGIFLSQDKHQVTPKECHMHVFKRIFRYLKGHPKLRLWYPKESAFDLTIVATLTTEAEYIAVASCCGQVLWIQNQLLDYGFFIIAVQTPGSGISILLAVGTPSTGNGNLYCQWELSPGSGNTLCILFPTTKLIYVVEHSKLGFVKEYLNIYTLFVSHFVPGWVIGTSNYLGVLRILMISLRLIPLSEHNVDFHPIVDFIEASLLRIEITKEGTKILATVDGILRTVSETSLMRNLKLHDDEGISSLLDTELFENLTLMGYNISSNQKFNFQKGQFSYQWKYLIHIIMRCLSPKSTGFNEFSINIATALVCLATNRTYNFLKMIFNGLVKNVNNKGEGSGTPTKPHDTPSPEDHPTTNTTYSLPTLPPVTTASIPTVTPSKTTPIRQYTRRARIAQSSALPLVADELTTPLRDELEINRLKERVKLLEDREGVDAERSGDDAPIKGRNLVEGEAAAKRVSDDTKEMATVLTSMDAATVLASGVADVPTASPLAAEVPTGSDVVPTTGLIFATAIVVTPYIRRKGKETLSGSNLKSLFLWTERLKRKGLILKQESVKKLKTSEEVTEEAKSPDEVPEEKVKEMMQLVPIEEVYVEALQVKHPIIDWKVHTEGQRAYWKLQAKDKEIFMLVEKDYPLRKGLAIGMISYKLQVKNYSRMANDLMLKIYKIASIPRQQGIEFPLAEEVSTASEESSHCQKKRDATAKRITLLRKVSHDYS